MDARTIARIVQVTTAAQGVPERLEDPFVVLKVGRLLHRTDRSRTD